MIVTNETLEEALDLIWANPELSIDTETSGLRPYQGDRLFGISVAGEGCEFYFNFNPNGPCLDRSIIPRIYEEVRGKILSFANAKFDMHFLCNEGWGTDFTPWDVLVVDKCIYNKHLSYSLDSVAKRYGFQGKDDAVMAYIKEHKLYEKEEIPGKKSVQQNPRFDRVPFEVISKYALLDARLTYDIYKLQEARGRELTAEYGKIKGYPVRFVELIEDECRLTKVLFDIERRGMELDYEYIKKAKKREEARIKAAKAQFTELTGAEFIDSNKHLSQVFSANGIVGGTTAKGNASFTDAVLEKIDHPAAGAVREYRDAYKRLNTYYNSFTYYGDSAGVVRPSIKQTAADTFRFSITNPALQTLNSEDNGDWRVRDSFRARPGFVYVSIDYSAQEYRLTADYAGERDLISQINQGVDVHSATAKMMGVDRHSAKVLNFALLYGAAPPKIASMLGVTVEKATELKNLYFSRLGKVSSFINNVKSTIDRRGYIFNFAGRVLHFPVIEFEQNGVMRKGNFAYKGPNYIIQSSGSEIMRRALILVHEFLLKFQSRIVLSVHDELLIEMDDNELHLIPRIRELMVSVYPPKNGLPMSTSVAIGESWGRLNDIDEDELTKRIDVQKARSVEAKEASECGDVHDSANVDQGNAGSASLCEWAVCGTGAEAQQDGPSDRATAI